MLATGWRDCDKHNVNAKRLLWVKFDSAFDMGETNRLYCSELVRLAINEAVGTNLVGFTKVCGRNVVAIDDLYCNGFRRMYDSHHPELCTNVVVDINFITSRKCARLDRLFAWMQLYCGCSNVRTVVLEVCPFCVDCVG